MRQAATNAPPKTPMRLKFITTAPYKPRPILNIIEVMFRAEKSLDRN
jgi:hypothetical protein